MKTCFLCNIHTGRKVLDFNKESFEKCYNMMLFRKKKNFKYGDIFLTADCYQVYGYHTSCYKSVTTLKHKFKKEFESFCKTQTVTGLLLDSDHQNSPTALNKLQQSSVSSAANVQPTSDLYVQAQSLTPELQSSLTTNDENSGSSTADVQSTSAFNVSSLRLLALMALQTKEEAPSATIFDSSSISKNNEESLPEANSKTACLFCNKMEKRIGGRRYYVSYPQSKSTIDGINEMAGSSNDSRILAKLEDNENIAYHLTCFTTYQVQKMKKKTKEPGRWHDNRQLHKEAFNSISELIITEIIKKKRVMFLVDLFSRYKALLHEFAENRAIADDFKIYRIEHFESKIMSAFGDRIAVEATNGSLTKKIVYTRLIDISQLAAQVANSEATRNNKLQDVAYELRNCVKSLECKHLPDNLSTDDVIRGECEIPEKLFEFMCNLIQGPDVRRKNSDEDLVKIKSVCSDIIYITTKGRVKPSKHLTLGLAMKTITSSRKVLTILNKYGHTINYNLAEEIETELTYTAHENNSVIPSGIDAINGLSTHVAFDNFDRFVDTCSGTGTLHDTVGIIYQFIQHKNVESSEMTTSNLSTSQLDGNIDVSSPPPRKRRRFEEIPRDIQPYYRKPTANMALLPVGTISDTVNGCKEVKEMAMIKDFLWAMSLSQVNLAPMWLGYNCMGAKDVSEIQNIGYLAPINSSPTSYAVVHETLVITSEVAEKCEQELIVVTYDLAIAKMAMQIQKNESPKFDNIFVNLGAFHMQMALFKAIGKFIDGSGLVDILVEAEVLAGGSTNSFLDGKHFNRCKRIHPLASGALQVLHFDMYLSQIESDPTVLTNDLLKAINTLRDLTDIDINDSTILPDTLQQILNDYKRFCEVTLEGGHGKTAQYYLQYTEFINLFHRFSRSIRSSNFELYLDSVYTMCDLFFIFNQPNYARWSAMYLNNLIKLKIEDSSLVTEFRRGAFGVRRTKASFARSPVDLTLEQTINADAGNTLTGISHFTNSISARQRWALSHSMRTKILSALKEDVGLSHKDDTSRSLQRNRIDKDNKNLNSIIKTIKNTINPFDANIDKNVLFNISTGKAASPDVSHFLINVCSLGCEQKLRFISECAEVPERFEKPIKQNKIQNFASQCAKKTQKSKDNSKQALLKMERDVFGRLLAIAVEKKVDIEHCLTYPLAPVPPALFQYTGEMFKTVKSTLAKELKSNIKPAHPGNIDMEVIDGFFFLHLAGPSLPQTFGKSAESILIKLCSTNASEVHIIFDRYLSPSIKDCEREIRHGYDIPYTIVGPLQPRPRDFSGSLKNYRFKEALVQFLVDYWKNDSFASILREKKVFITVGEQCYSYRSDGKCVIQTEELTFQCQHEEADTRIMFHISKAPPKSNILVKATDTDVLVILLGNMHKVPELQIWLADTTSKKGDKRDQICINCTELASKLGPSLCLALPAFHAFTGCDYSAAFYNKGKIRPFKMLRENETMQKVFASFTNKKDIEDAEKMKAVQNYTAMIYGIKNCGNVNEARYRIFLKTYGNTKRDGSFFKKIKGFNSSLIPPCFKSMEQKILRTIYINSMWQNATNITCSKMSPEEYGWMRDDDGQLRPVWFIGDPTPLQVSDIVCLQNSDSEDSEYDVSSSDESEDW